LPTTKFTWNWFNGEGVIGLDRREYLNVNYDMIPPFGREVLEETDEYIVARNYVL